MQSVRPQIVIPAHSEGLKLNDKDSNSGDMKSGAKYFPDFKTPQPLGLPKRRPKAIQPHAECKTRASLHN